MRITENVIKFPLRLGMLIWMDAIRHKFDQLTQSRHQFLTDPQWAMFVCVFLLIKFTLAIVPSQFSRWIWETEIIVPNLAHLLPCVTHIFLHHFYCNQKWYIFSPVVTRMWKLVALNQTEKTENLTENALYSWLSAPQIPLHNIGPFKTCTSTYSHNIIHMRSTMHPAQGTSWFSSRYNRL